MTPSKQVSLTPWRTTQGFFLVLNIRHRNNKHLGGVGFLDQHKPTDWPLQRFTGGRFFPLDPHSQRENVGTFGRVPVGNLFPKSSPICPI